MPTVLIYGGVHWRFCTRGLKQQSRGWWKWFCQRSQPCQSLSYIVPFKPSGSFEVKAFLFQVSSHVCLSQLSPVAYRQHSTYRIIKGSPWVNGVGWEKLAEESWHTLPPTHGLQAWSPAGSHGSSEKRQTHGEWYGNCRMGVDSQSVNRTLCCCVVVLG